MNLFLDQMFAPALAEKLRAAGYNAVRASERGKARADDAEILQQATGESRVLVTLDDHFGDWAVLPLQRHSGVIRLRVHPTTTENIWTLLEPLLTNHSQEEFVDRLVIVSKNRIRWITTAEP